MRHPALSEVTQREAIQICERLKVLMAKHSPVISSCYQGRASRHREAAAQGESMRRRAAWERATPGAARPQCQRAWRENHQVE